MVFGKRPQQEGVFSWGLATLSQLNAPSFAVCGAQSIIQAHLIKLLSSFQSLKSKRNVLAASILSLKKASTTGLIRPPWKLFKQRIVQFSRKVRLFNQQLSPLAGPALQQAECLQPRLGALTSLTPHFCFPGEGSARTGFLPGAAEVLRPGTGGSV